MSELASLFKGLNITSVGVEELKEDLTGDAATTAIVPAATTELTEPASAVVDVPAVAEPAAPAEPAAVSEEHVVEGELTVEYVETLIEQEGAFEQDHSDLLEHADGFSDLHDDASKLVEASGELEETLSVAQECLATGADSAVVGRFLGLSLRKAHLSIGLLSDESDVQEQVGGPEVPTGDSMELPKDGVGVTIAEPEPAVAEGEGAAPVVTEPDTADKPANEFYATASVESIANNIKAGANAAVAKAKELLQKFLAWIKNLFDSVARSEKYLTGIKTALHASKNSTETVRVLDSSVGAAFGTWVTQLESFKAAGTPVNGTGSVASRFKWDKKSLSTSGAIAHIGQLESLLGHVKALKGLSSHFESAGKTPLGLKQAAAAARQAAVGAHLLLTSVNRDAKTIRSAFVKKRDIMAEAHAAVAKTKEGAVKLATGK